MLNINQTTKDRFKITHCSSLKVFCSFNKKLRKFNYYTEDYAVLFYIRLLIFSSRLLTEYFRLKLKAQFVSFVSFFFPIVFLSFFYWQFNYFQSFLGPFLTNISYSGIENCAISLVSKM